MLLIVGLVVIFVATPYARAASLIVRAANLGGRAEAFADEHARTGHGANRRTWCPRATATCRRSSTCRTAMSSRAVLLVPGIHSMGIEEPRLTALAQDLAGTGVTVMTMALPDLQALPDHAAARPT